MLIACEPIASGAVERSFSLSGTVRVWEADLDAFVACTPRWAERLSDAERSRAARLGAVGGQARFIARRTLLRDLLQHTHAPLPRGDWPPGGNDSAGSIGGVHYAVAQRAGFALIALAARPIGLGLERVDAVVNELLPDVLAASERAALTALPAPCTALAAALLLASKQAYSRARRTDGELSSLVVELVDGCSPRLITGLAGDDAADWTLMSLSTAPGHIAVLAIPGGDDWRLARHRPSHLLDWQCE